MHVLTSHLPRVMSKISKQFDFVGREVSLKFFWLYKYRAFAFPENLMASL